MGKKNVIIAIDYAEQGLVRAVKKLSKKLGAELEPILLVDTKFTKFEDYKRSDKEFFREIICDFDNPDEIQNVLKDLQYRILAVSCRNDAAIQDYQKVIPFLPYTNTPTESSLLWATEKRFMRDRLRGYDQALVPKYVQLTEVDMPEIENLIEDFEFPVIVKPNGLRLSLLVTKCADYKELQECLERTFNVLDDVYEKESGTGTPSLLIEEFIVGDLYSVDAYISPDGEITCMPPIRTVTAHDKGLEGFYGFEFLLPTELTDDEVMASYATTKLAIRALNLRSCTSHVELYKCKGNTWKVVELGPRIGGHRDELYMAAYGVDHYYNDLASRLGLELEIPQGKSNFVSCMGIYPETEGNIDSITGLDTAQNLDGVVSIEAKMQKGDTAIFAQNGGRSAVHASLESTSLDGLEKLIEKVRSVVKINTI